MKGNASCTECLNEASNFLNLLGQNTTIANIEQIGALSCEEKFVDPDLADECSAFIDQYLPQVIDIIENELPPAEICVELKHCPAP
ncbi:Saposin-like type B, region 2 [compost metagenome]